MLILYSGSDSYRLHRATGDLIASYAAEFGTALHMTVVDGTAQDAAEQIERPLKYPSFFNDKSLIVVRGAASPATAATTTKISTAVFIVPPVGLSYARVRKEFVNRRP